MISKEEVLYGQLAVVSGFISEDDLRQAIETKQKLVEKAQEQANGARAPSLGAILRKRGLIDNDEHEFLQEKLAGRAPKTLGGFEVVKKLGQGAMGAVYKARQVSMNRLVAIKLLSRQLSSNDKFVARFEREARMVGQLNHPNIVAGIDSGKEDGVYYYVMEFVEGRELDEIVEEDGPLAEPVALDYALQLARALEHAHQHHMVHRDVKPENVMINEEGVAKLCDLGLAKPDDDSANLTLAGSSMGTPHYISPEQAQGLSDQIDIRSDIYSLGVTLWYCLIGDVPFRADSPALVLTAHIDEPLPDPQEKAPHLSNGVCGLLRRMLAKSANDRQKNPTEVIEDIEALLAGQQLPQRKRGQSRAKQEKQPVPGRRPASGEGSRRVPRRRRPSRASEVRPAVRRRPASNNMAIGGVIGGAVLLLVIVIALASGGGGDEEQPTPSRPGTNKGAAARGDDTDARAARQALEAARSQMNVVREYEKANPTDYLGAIKQYEKLLAQYASYPLAAAEIKQRVADIKRKAEGEVAKLRLALDAEVTRLLGRGQLGEAYDKLKAFPPYLEFTEGARDLLTRRKELGEKLKKAYDELQAAADRLKQAGKTTELLALLRQNLPRFDAARREEIRDQIRVLEDQLRASRTATLRKIHEGLERLRPDIQAAIKSRDYRKAREAIAPLLALARPFAGERTLEPLRLLAWDLALLVLLQQAVDAAYQAEHPGKAPGKLSTDRYVAVAERGKTGSDTRWPLALAVFYFHEDRLDVSMKQMGDAIGAGLDVKPLKSRLDAQIGPWREKKAEEAFQSLKTIDEGMDWDDATMRKDFLAAISSFESNHGKTAFARSKADIIAGWKNRLSGGEPAPKKTGKVKLEDFPKHLNGRVIKWDPKKLYLKIHYSLKKKKQLDDWKAGLGGQGRGQEAGSWDLEKGWISGGGNTGFYNLIHFKKKVALTCQALSANPRTCGISLHVENAARRYFFGFNLFVRRQRWGTYISLIDGERMPDMLQTSGRAMKDNQVYLLKAQIADKRLLFSVNGKLMLQTTDGTLDKGRVGFDAWRSNAMFRNVLIEGIVDRPWLEQFLRQQAAKKKD